MHLFISILFYSKHSIASRIHLISNENLLHVFPLKIKTKSFSSSEIRGNLAKYSTKEQQSNKTGNITLKLEIMSRCDYIVYVSKYVLCVLDPWKVIMLAQKKGIKIILRNRCFTVTVFVCIFTFLFVDFFSLCLSFISFFFFFSTLLSE